MPTLISIDEFRERFDIDTEIASPRIEPHIGSASRRLRTWVGTEKYAAAAAAAIAEDPAAADVELLDDLKNAEASLAMHFAILGLNSPLSGKGVVATSMSSEGREMTKYLTPEETAKLSVQFLEMAREIAEPYIAEDDNIGFGIVTDEINTEIPWLP